MPILREAMLRLLDLESTEFVPAAFVKAIRSELDRTAAFDRSIDNLLGAATKWEAQEPGTEADLKASNRLTEAIRKTQREAEWVTRAIVGKDHLR